MHVSMSWFVENTIVRSKLSQSHACKVAQTHLHVTAHHAQAQSPVVSYYILESVTRSSVNRHAIKSMERAAGLPMLAVCYLVAQVFSFMLGMLGTAITAQILISGLLAR